MNDPKMLKVNDTILSALSSAGVKVSDQMQQFSTLWIRSVKSDFCSYTILLPFFLFDMTGSCSDGQIEASGSVVPQAGR